MSADPTNTPETLDDAISFYVNRGLIHEDRWDDLKAALSAMVKSIISDVSDPDSTYKRRILSEQRQRAAKMGFVVNKEGE